MEEIKYYKLPSKEFYPIDIPSLLEQQILMQVLWDEHLEFYSFQCDENQNTFENQV